MKRRFKIFSDPVHGFISVPKGLIMALLQTPEVQRLRRIRQLGVGHLVFPGAEHTRFGHALGAMALMHDALTSISDKGTEITEEEYTAAMAAALLHDVGHGPYSHTLEHDLIGAFRHEDMSRALLLQLDERFGGALDVAIEMFDGTYHRPFFHQLVSSQLDMDRLDYLRRDSFYTGVVEGKVGVQRIIKTLLVHPPEGGAEARVAIESKGIYAVENYLIARRLMYWQVYLHKSVLAGDHVLRGAFARVRHLLKERPGLDVGGSPDLLFFLERALTRADIGRRDVREAFCRLDDTDVLFSLKTWMRADDAILADLSRRFIHRDLFRVAFLPTEPTDAQRRTWQALVAGWLADTGLSDDASADNDVAYYLSGDRSRHAAYEPLAGRIRVLDRDGNLHELSEMTDDVATTALSQLVVKPYVCYPKEIVLQDGVEHG